MARGVVVKCCRGVLSNVVGDIFKWIKGLLPRECFQTDKEGVVKGAKGDTQTGYCKGHVQMILYRLQVI